MNHNISKNYIYNLLYQFINVIIQLITLPYLSRVIGEDGIGIQSYTNSVISIIMIFAVLGIDWYGQREIANSIHKKKERSLVFYELIIIKFISFVILSLIIYGFIILDKKYSIYYSILLIWYFGNMLDISWMYKGVEDFKVISIRNIIVKITGIILIFLFIKTKKDVAKYIFILSITTFIGNLLMWIGLSKFVDNIHIKELKIKRHFKPLLQYFIPTIATSIYLLLDKSMIGRITHSDAQNGYYEQAIQVVNMLKTIVLSYNSVMISRMTIMFKNNNRELTTKTIDNSFEFLMFISWPICFGILSVGQEFVTLYYGHSFTCVANILYIFSPIIIFVAISNLLESHIITPLNMRSNGNLAVILGAITNFILNIFLIRRLEAIGAAIASVISELVIAVVYIIYTNKIYNFKHIVNNMYKKIIASIIMYIVINRCIHLSVSNIDYMIIKILLGIFVYGFILFILNDKFIYNSMKYIKEKIIN